MESKRRTYKCLDSSLLMCNFYHLFLELSKAARVNQKNLFIDTGKTFSTSLYTQNAFFRKRIRTDTELSLLL